MIRLLLAPAALALATVAAQTQLTQAQLKSLDTKAATKLLLGVAGEQMVEHHIALGEGNFGPSDPRSTILYIDFAATPRQRDNRICEADAIRISFTPDRFVASSADLPVHVKHLRSRKLWGLLPAGAIDCRALGPVLESWAEPRPFFDAKDPGGGDLPDYAVIFAARMLRELLANPQGEQPLRCVINRAELDGRQAACEARRFAEVVDPSRLSLLQVGACSGLRPKPDRGPFCVSFQFDDRAGSIGSRTHLRVTFVTDLQGGAVLAYDTKVVRVVIDRFSWIA